MPQAPALQAQSPTSTKEGRWKEEDEGEPSGQAKETAVAAGAAVRARLSPSRQIAFCSLLFDCVSPNVLFWARELPFNSSRKQLRNLCFF